MLKDSGRSIGKTNAKKNESGANRIIIVKILY